MPLSLHKSSSEQVDAMSDAVDNAEVMLSCISLAYKESASTDPHLVLKPAIEKLCMYIRGWDSRLLFSRRRLSP